MSPSVQGLRAMSRDAKSRVRIPGLALVIALMALLQLHPAFADGPSPLFETASAAAESSSATTLFGMDTEPVAHGEVLNKWRHARDAIEQDRQTVDRCRTDSACSAVAQRLIALSSEGDGHDGRAKVGLINRAVDLAISPIADEAQWSVLDYWSAPLQTLQSGQGDCEDYAIVKYAALAAAGIAESDMKIVILTNAFPNEDHAVLAVRVEGEWLILDNRRLALVRDTEITRAVPKLVLDQAGVRRFLAKGRTRRVG